MKRLVHFISLAVLCASLSCTNRDRIGSIDLLVVNGRSLTVGRIRELVKLEQSLSERGGKTFNPEGLKKRLNSIAYRLIPRELVRMLISAELDQLRIVSTKESDDIVLKRYNKRIRGKCLSLSSMADSFPDKRELFLDKLCYESRLEAYCLSIAQDLKVADEELSARIDYESCRRSRSIEANSNAWKRAEACYAELKSGAEWKDMAKKYSEDLLVSSNNLELAESWMNYPVSGNTVDPEIALPLRELKIGEFTAPIDTDYGLLIVRLIRRDDTDLTCARILFRMLDVPNAPTDREALRKQMEREALNQHMNALTRQLFKKAKIQYPMGETITYEIF